VTLNLSNESFFRSWPHLIQATNASKTFLCRVNHVRVYDSVLRWIDMTGRQVEKKASEARRRLAIEKDTALSFSLN